MRASLVSISFATMLTAMSAQARIGETERQIDARYGKPVVKRNSAALSKGYRYRGFEIIVTFLDGVSVMEQYWKQGGLQMTPGELGSLLQANSGGDRWPEPDQVGFELHYLTRHRFAEYSTLTKKLMLAERDGLNRLAARGMAFDVQKMKGF